MRLADRPVSDRLLILALSAAAALAASSWGFILTLPHMVERVEVHVKALVAWWRQGLLPYVDPRSLPFIQNPYGPIYPLVVARLPGELGGDAYLGGRLLSILAVAVTLGWIAFWVWRRTGELWPAVVAALLPLTAKPLLLFAPLYRVDSLAMALSLAGFVLATIGRTPPTVAVAGLAFLFAFSTKLTFVAAPIAAVVWLWSHERRRAGQLALLLVTLLPTSIVAMEWLTGGFYLASAALGNLPSGPGKSLDMLARTGLWLFWWLAVVAAIRRRPSRLGPSLVWRSPAFLYLVSSLGLAVAFAANPLSSWNYLIEPCVALALLTGEVIAGPVVRGSRVVRWLLIHALVSLPLMAIWIVDSRRDIDSYRTTFDAARACLGELPSDARVAIVGSLAAHDAVNASGVPGFVVATASLEETPEVESLVHRAAAAGHLDVVWLTDTTAGDLSCSPWRAPSL